MTYILLYIITYYLNKFITVKLEKEEWGWDDVWANCKYSLLVLVWPFIYFTARFLQSLPKIKFPSKPPKWL